MSNEDGEALHFNYFDPKFHKADPRADLSAEGQTTGFEWDNPHEASLDAIVAAHPMGAPCPESFDFKHMSDEQILANVQHLLNDADASTPYERAELQQLMDYNKESGMTEWRIGVLRQYLSRLEDKRFRRLLFAYDRARNPENAKLSAHRMEELRVEFNKRFEEVNAHKPGYSEYAEGFRKALEKGGFAEVEAYLKWYSGQTKATPPAQQGKRETPDTSPEAPPATNKTALSFLKKLLRKEPRKN